MVVGDLWIFWGRGCSCFLGGPPKIGGNPQIMNFNRVVHYKASLLGGKHHPYFWFNTLLCIPFLFLNVAAWWCAFSQDLESGLKSDDCTFLRIDHHRAGDRKSLELQRESIELNTAEKTVCLELCLLLGKRHQWKLYEIIWKLPPRHFVFPFSYWFCFLWPPILLADVLLLVQVVCMFGNVYVLICCFRYCRNCVFFCVLYW